MAAPHRPSGPPLSSPETEDWAGQAADAVVSVVDAVREKTTGPVLTVARAIVYGLIGVFAALVAFVLVTIALVRFTNVYLPGGVWAAHLLIGVVFIVSGLFVWRKRNAPEVA
jgi:hypothetical protein